MTFADLIEKKKQNQQLTEVEIDWLIKSYLKEDIADYQMASMLMAIWFNGMTEKETAALTKAYVESGITYDISDIQGFKADKHSTGGVGDKTTLVFAPLVASYGIKVCKLSGRGLGQTGGTIDKLESFPGWKSEISDNEFKKVINKVGMSLMSQNEGLVPADKKIYALRDVTGTVDSIPLIAASIMSKKLVIENDSLILDVKMGNGAFMKTLTEAENLAQAMIGIARQHNRQIAIMITDMNKPLGKAIGNALEVKEAWDSLNGKGPEDFNHLVATAVAITLVQAQLFDDFDIAYQSVCQKMQTGEAAHIFEEFVKAQHGNFSVIKNYDKHFAVANSLEIKAMSSGYVNFTNANQLGLLSMRLGAGRATKKDKIDFAAGIYLNADSGSRVNKGDTIMTLFTNKGIDPNWIDMAYQTFEISQKQTKTPVILKIIK
ncbi:thymidine phosphorylase [Mesoplasma syrphidae]|uniref:Thymidine phosphorylase n=1 Tax=Mesoplasma syrphidae TaxID=225999 RepID=A0A2K9CA18_9MOLU|nr:thymidine phosphorylase [Mesoplasma syrphidae]AUF83855.1 thymidine phosphorylase [Mesoplasma syrphidae]